MASVPGVPESPPWRSGRTGRRGHCAGALHHPVTSAVSPGVAARTCIPKIDFNLYVTLFSDRKRDAAIFFIFCVNGRAIKAFFQVKKFFFLKAGPLLPSPS